MYVTVASAGQPGEPRGSVFESADIGLISVSGNYSYQDRSVPGPWLLESQSAYAVLSVDPFISWLTLSIGGGSTQVKPGPHEHYDDWGSVWTAGIKLGLWEYKVKDPDYLLSRVRIIGSGSYWDHDTQIRDEDVGWDEWRASLLFSAEFFTEDLGTDRQTYPYAAVYTVGPIYSRVDSDCDGRGHGPGVPGTRYDFGEQGDWGLQIGIDIYLAHNFSFGWEARTFDGFHGKSHDLHLAIHF